MRNGVDYSYRPSSWAAFFDDLMAAGYSAIIRYLYDDYDPRPGRGEKRVTREELEVAWSRGILTGFWWETSEGAALGGYNVGVDHAHRALAQLAELGLPLDLPVIYCVDTDVTYSQLASPVRQYFEGVLSVVGDVGRIGVYGGYPAVWYLMEVGLAAYGAQTEAWSYLNGYWPTPPVWYPGAQIHQWTVHAPAWCANRDLDALDIYSDEMLYHPEGGDQDMTKDQDRMLKECRVSDIARSWDIKILRAEIRGNAALAEELEDQKAVDVAKNKRALGLELTKEEKALLGI